MPRTIFSLLCLVDIDDLSSEFTAFKLNQCCMFMEDALYIVNEYIPFTQQRYCTKSSKINKPCDEVERSIASILHVI